MYDAVVIGGGPSGLMAAEMLADRGVSTLVAEAKPTVGRKLLMAGKSGLNLTKDQPLSDFLAAYDEAEHWLRAIIGEFDNLAVQDWARGLGQSVFTGSTGRVFPEAMKASPLLRAWLVRLAEKNVTVRTRWRWNGWQADALQFETSEGFRTLTPKVVVLALGGASWSRLGSNGKWHRLLAEKSVDLTPFQPANVGYTVNWSPYMSRVFGQPVKASLLKAGNNHQRGEFVISAKGLEGGGIYAISKSLRQGTALFLDLLPDLTLEKVASRIGQSRGKTSLSNHLRKVLRLDPAKLALLQEFARPLPQAPVSLAKVIKNLPIVHDGPRPLDEAISTAGGADRPTDAETAAGGFLRR